MKKVWNFLTGLVLSIAVTVILVLLFALIVKWFSLTSAVISPVNRAIKVVGIFTACVYAAKSKGIVTGFLLGAAYIFFTTLIFSAVSNGSIWNFSLLWELLFGTIVGALCGVISSNLKRRA